MLEFHTFQLLILITAKCYLALCYVQRADLNQTLPEEGPIMREETGNQAMVVIVPRAVTKCGQILGTRRGIALTSQISQKETCRHVNQTIKAGPDDCPHQPCVLRCGQEKEPGLQAPVHCGYSPGPGERWGTLSLTEPSVPGLEGLGLCPRSK